MLIILTICLVKSAFIFGNNIKCLTIGNVKRAPLSTCYYAFTDDKYADDRQQLFYAHKYVYRLCNLSHLNTHRDIPTHAIAM